MIKAIVNSISRSFRRKFIFVSVVSVLAGLLISSIIALYSFMSLGNMAYSTIKHELTATMKDYLENYMSLVVKRAYKTYTSSGEELIFLSEIIQTVLDNPYDMQKMGVCLNELPYFKDNFFYNKKFKQLETKADEATALIVPGSLLTPDRKPNQEAEEFIRNTEYLDMIMPSLIKVGIEKRYAYMTGPEKMPILRYCPHRNDWIDAWDFDWKRDYPGLIEEWEKVRNTSGHTAKDTVTFLEPSMDLRNNSIIISVANPLWNDKKNKFAGAVGFEIVLSALQKTIQDIKVSDTGFAFISKSDGNILIIGEQGAKTLGLSEKRTKIREIDDNIVKLDRNIKNSIHPELVSFVLPQDDKPHIDTIKLVINGTPAKYILATQCMPPVRVWNKEKGLHMEKCVVGIILPEDEVYEALDIAENELYKAFLYTIVTQIIAALLSLALVTICIIKISTRLTSGIKSLVGAAEKIKNKQYDVSIKISSNDEISQLENAFNNMIGEIHNHTENLEQLVNERTTELGKAHHEMLDLNKRLKADNKRLGAELDIVRRLQMMVLPRRQEIEAIKAIEIATSMIPANEVGGDYYDAIQDGAIVRIGVGDITGHGLESGVLMLMVQTAARTLIENGENDPVKFLNTINKVIYKNSQRIGTDKNLTLLFMDYSNNYITVYGQHEEVLIIRKDGTLEVINTMDLGFIVGLEEDITNFINPIRIPFSTGDAAILFTDGVTEAQNENGDFYTSERLCRISTENHSKSAMEIKNAIIEDLMLFIDSRTIYDDITLLVIKNIAETEYFGEFNDKMLETKELFRADFKKETMTLKDCGKSSDAAADKFILSPEVKKLTDAEIKDISATVKYVTNELFENSFKFSCGGDIAFSLRIVDGNAVIITANNIEKASIEQLKIRINKLISEDPKTMMIEQMEANAEEKDVLRSGLGYLTMLSDYDIKLGWKFLCSQSGDHEECKLLTMATIKI